MSGIYIHGMEMPKEGFVEILIRDDGTVQQTGQSYRIDGTDYYTPYVGEMPVMYEATPVPAHGRLIDADAFSDRFSEGKNLVFSLPLSQEFKLVYAQLADDMCEEIKARQTIIPASEESSERRGG